jgi:type VI secretion system secreted protein Hcp
MKHITTTLLIALTCLLSATAARAAHVDYFLEIENIPGEVTIAKHSGHIAVDSFHTSAYQRALTSLAGGAASPSKAVIKPIQIVKPVDKSSPQLFLACMTGKTIPKVTLYADYMPVDQYTGPTGTFMKITLTDVVVASIDTAGERSDAVAAEAVTLSFRSMEVSYQPVLANGTLGPATIASFNFTRNTAGQ